MPSRKSSRNHNDYSLSRRYFDDKQTNISHLFRSGVTTPADMEVTEVTEVMEVKCNNFFRDYKIITKII